MPDENTPATPQANPEGAQQGQQAAGQPSGQQQQNPPDGGQQQQPPKPDGQQQPPKADDGQQQQGAPEQYADFTMPEGYEANPELLQGFSELAKSHNLTQEQAQAFIDLAAKQQQGVQQAQQEYWDGVREQWVQSLKDDAEFGGAKFDETVIRAQRVLKTHGSPELTKFLQDTGYGDNKDLVVMLAKIDKLYGEPLPAEGAPAGKTQKSAAEVMYPNS